MSTPRLGHANYCLYTPGGNSTCICGEIKYPSSVAAPLELSRCEARTEIARLIFKRVRLAINPHLHGEIIDVAEAYAAAVSKNLQEELAQAREAIDFVQRNRDDIGQCYVNKVLELEKEITALRKPERQP
jgi:hypothetical protein